MAGWSIIRSSFGNPSFRMTSVKPPIHCVTSQYSLTHRGPVTPIHVIVCEFGHRWLKLWLGAEQTTQCWFNSIHELNLWHAFGNYTFWITIASLRGKWVKWQDIDKLTSISKAIEYNPGLSCRRHYRCKTALSEMTNTRTGKWEWPTFQYGSTLLTQCIHHQDRDTNEKFQSKVSNEHIWVIRKCNSSRYQASRSIGTSFNVREISVVFGIWFSELTVITATSWSALHDVVSNHQRHHCLLNRLFKAHIKENIKAPRHWPWWWGPRWIPGTNVQ